MISMVPQIRFMDVQRSQGITDSDRLRCAGSTSAVSEMGSLLRIPGRAYHRNDPHHERCHECNAQHLFGPLMVDDHLLLVEPAALFVVWQRSAGIPPRSQKDGYCQQKTLKPAETCLPRPAPSPLGGCAHSLLSQGIGEPCSEEQGSRHTADRPLRRFRVYLLGLRLCLS